MRKFSSTCQFKFRNVIRFFRGEKVLPDWKKTWDTFDAGHHMHTYVEKARAKCESKIWFYIGKRSVLDLLDIVCIIYPVFVSSCCSLGVPQEIRPMHRRIKRQKARQRSSLIFWLFDAAEGVIVRQIFKKRSMKMWWDLNLWPSDYKLCTLPLDHQDRKVLSDSFVDFNAFSLEYSSANSWNGMENQPKR